MYKYKRTMQWATKRKRKHQNLIILLICRRNFNALAQDPVARVLVVVWRLLVLVAGPGPLLRFLVWIIGFN